jgi:hypothetical protein
MRIGQPKRMLSGWRGTGDSGRDTHQECFVVDLEEGADHGERRARLVAVVDGVGGELRGVDRQIQKGGN